MARPLSDILLDVNSVEWLMDRLQYSAEQEEADNQKVKEIIKQHFPSMKRKADKEFRRLKEERRAKIRQRLGEKS